MVIKMKNKKISNGFESLKSSPGYNHDYSGNISCALKFITSTENL